MEPEVTTPTEQETVVPESTDTQDVDTTEAFDWEAEATKHKSAFEDQKRRAEKAEARLKDLERGSTKVEKSTPKNDNDRIAELEARLAETTTKAELIARGYTEVDEQDIIIQASKVLNKQPHEVISNPLVKQQIEELRSMKKTEDVSPSPSRRGGSAQSSVERTAKQVLAGEKSLTSLDADTKGKVLEYMDKNNLF